MIMKVKTLITSILFIFMATNLHANGKPSYTASAKTDSLGHVLVSLWKDYQKAKDADLPQNQTGILEQIMQKAKSEKLYWDYSCASIEWYDVVIHRNWKLQDSCKTRIMSEIAEMDCPILTYTIKKRFSDFSDDVDFVSEIQTRAGELRKSENRGFYSALKGHAPQFIIDGMSNDYEYLLWVIGIYGDRVPDPAIKIAAELLNKELNRKYPQTAYLEFLDLLKNNPYTVGDPGIIPYFEDEVFDWYDETDYEDDDEYDEDDEEEYENIIVPNPERRRKALEEFSHKYAGKAIVLLAEQQILVDTLHDLEKEDLKGNNSARSEKYKSLRASLETLKRRREAFSGEEKKVAAAAERIDELIGYLDEKKIDVTAKDGVISIYMQNVDSVRLKLLCGDKELLKVKVKNPVCSYFCTDTVTYAIPPCNDGDYDIECVSGKLTAETSYTMRSISIAHRDINTGIGIYIADYKTGRPIEVADLIISRDSKVVSEMKDFKFDGFTSIQDALESVAGKDSRRFDVRCSYTDVHGYFRTSKNLSFWVKKGEYAVEHIPEPKLKAKIFMDRAAFNPGDSVQFKVLVYKSQNDEKFKIAGNMSMSVVLLNPDNKMVAKDSLVTNEFGTIAGGFTLSKECKGGTYKIYVNHKKNLIASSYITVDEFVLPAYDLVFDKTDCPYFSGDTVSVRGKLTSYSGHSLSSVKVAYEIWYHSNDEVKTLTGNVIADTDGRFNIQFVADKDIQTSRTYHLEVKATALNGETWEWEKELTVNPKSSMKIKIDNQTDGRALSGGEKISAILSGSVATVSFMLNIPELDILPKVPVNYVVSREGARVLSGTAVSDEVVNVDFTNLPSAIYKIEATAEYITPQERKIELSAESTLLNTGIDDDSIVDGLDYFYKRLDNGRIGFQFGTAEEERWFVVEAYGSDLEVLHSETFCLGKAHKTVQVFDTEYMTDYTDAVLVNIFSFKDSAARNQSFLYERPKVEYVFPLSFFSFTDKALPHSEYTMILQTGLEAEAVVSIFDKASETIRRNYWSSVQPRTPSFSVYISHHSGENESGGSTFRHYYTSNNSYWDDNGVVTPLYDRIRYYDRVQSFGARLGRGLENCFYAADSMGEIDRDEPEEMGKPEEENIDTSDVQVRDGMDHSSVFLPFLRSDNDGKIEFSFTTSDRASTYIVSVFAHDKDMKNAVLRREMVVSLPLELSVAQPQFLYEGDVYKLRATVSNSDENAFEGNMVLEVYDTEVHKNAEPVAKYSHALTVGGRNAATAEFEIDVPQGVSVLGLKVAYIGTEMVDGSADSVPSADASSAAPPTVSDAIFVSIPVKVPTQTVTEAHSAVISGGADIEAAKATLAAEFTGTDATGAEYSEFSLIDMLTKAIPAEIKSEGKDVISRDKKFYAGRMAEYLAKRAGVKIPVTDNPMTLIDKILSCRNSDGGFGWFEGFNSSPIITAFILEDFAILSERGLLSDKVSAKMGPVLEAAVKYLDNKQLEDYPIWGGALSTEQYLRVRTLYQDVAFNPVIPKAVSVETGGSGAKAASDDKTGKTSKTSKTKKTPLEKFTEDVKNYLLPEEKSSLNGRILSKGRRILVSSVLASKEGAALAKAWGLESSVGELAKSVDADLVSLSQYAVEHRSGGVYYPNAVLPFRGLLESEAYAHAFLCGLMEKFADKDAEYHRIAEGIRLWLMIQKETQQWDDDPSFLDAICMVLDGSDKTLNTRIAVLTKQYSKPLSEIKAAGNGFTVERKFYRMLPEFASTKLRKVELKEGDVLNVGDKVIAEYHVWNEENRSFVRLETPRYAAFRPVEQLSGYVGTLARFILYVGFGCYYPSAYREVKADRTILYFDVLVEENSTFTEEFYVTQAGTFATPAITVESAYAPHYRANDKAAFAITIE